MKLCYYEITLYITDGYKIIVRARWIFDIFHIFMKKKEKPLYPTVSKWLCIYKISCSIREATTRYWQRGIPRRVLATHPRPR